MKTFKFNLEISVDDSWIEDGFGFTNEDDKKRFVENIQKTISTNILSYAYEHEKEIKLELTSFPLIEEMKKLQGYSDFANDYICQKNYHLQN